MLRITAFVLTVIVLASCGSKPSNTSGIYASIDYTIDEPNPIVAGIPRYFYFRDERHISVYFPIRIGGSAERKRRASFVWAMETWQVKHIADHPGETGQPYCCYYGAFCHGKTKGTIFVTHSAQGDSLTWFNPQERELRQEHGYVRVGRRLPKPGSRYSFAPHLLRISV